MDGHVPSELHGKWVDPVDVTRLKPCGLNGSQKTAKAFTFFRMVREWCKMRMAIPWLRGIVRLRRASLVSQHPKSRI